MIRIRLDGQWLMTDKKGTSVTGNVPGSVYSFLLDAGLMVDPYYRDNELAALKLMDEDYTFSRRFLADSELLACGHQVLRFEGIDTVAEVWLNGILLGTADNMHITWEFDVQGILHSGENELRVVIFSPTAYIRRKDKEYHLGGSYEAMRGFPHLRKAHCMFGWDWGPRLPDGGIWRSVWLEGWNESRIMEIRIRQVHRRADSVLDNLSLGSESLPGESVCHESDTLADGSAGFAVCTSAAQREEHVCVDLTVEVIQTCERTADAVKCTCEQRSVEEQHTDMPVTITLTGPDGRTAELENGTAYRIDHPHLWWPNGMGEQPLYEVRAVLHCPDGDQAVTRRIGLRTITMKREKDKWGETFAMVVNGRSVFSMGADYIPEDNILSRMNRERTEKLLEICRQSHFNVIRVWGGGFYPADRFYDLCDEMGLVVWQDLMFACANYRLTDEFV